MDYDLKTKLSKVDKFAELMKQKLREKEPRKSWEDAYMLHLFSQLLEEVSELARAMFISNGVARECADVANFAMMIADITGGLEDGSK